MLCISLMFKYQVFVSNLSLYCVVFNFCLSLSFTFKFQVEVSRSWLSFQCAIPWHEMTSHTDNDGCLILQKITAEEEETCCWQGLLGSYCCILDTGRHPVYISVWIILQWKIKTSYYSVCSEFQYYTLLQYIIKFLWYTNFPHLTFQQDFQGYVVAYSAH